MLSLKMSPTRRTAPHRRAPGRTPRGVTPGMASRRGAGAERDGEDAAGRRRHEGAARGHGIAGQPSPTHSITWSARSRRDCGIVSPANLAVLTLITSSNLVGCSTGRSPGLTPFRILSTYTAARRKLSSMEGP